MLEFVKNRFNEDVKKLRNLDNSKLYFSQETTEKHIGIIEDLFKEILKESWNLENLWNVVDLFTITKGNNKKLNDIAIISMGLYYLCPNLLNNSCKISHRCYGAKNERFKGVIKSRLKNYIFFACCEWLVENDFKSYLMVTSWTIDKNQKKLTEVMRINQQSDFRNDKQLFIVNHLLNIIKREYIPNCIFYSYSKADLDFGLYCDDDFRVNESIIIQDQTDLDSFLKDKYNDENSYYLTLMQKNLNLFDLFNSFAHPCKNDCKICLQCARYEIGDNLKFCKLH